MHCVPAKTAEQQAILVVHRVRAAVVAAHTRTANPIRGLLAEFGIVVPKGVATLKARWHEVRQRFADDAPALAWDELDALFDQLRTLHTRVLAYDRKLKAFIRQNPTAQRLTAVKGIGTMTASALVATDGSAHEFRNGRQFAAKLGLTPRQHSTGGKNRLGRIAERGDVHLRTLLVDVARSELMYTPRRSDSKSLWVERLKATKSWNTAAVALANKHARIAWAILAHGTDYQSA